MKKPKKKKSKALFSALKPLTGRKRPRIAQVLLLVRPRENAPAWWPLFGTARRAWVTVTPGGGWTYGVDRAKTNWVSALEIGDLQLAWIDDYAGVNDAPHAARTWEFRTVDTTTVGDNGTLAGVLR